MLKILTLVAAIMLMAAVPLTAQVQSDTFGKNYIEVRLVVDSAQANAARIPLVGSVWSFFLGDLVCLETKDIQGAEAFHDVKAFPSVVLLLTREGGAKWQTFTATHLKQRFALIVDGRLLAAPAILAPSTQPRLAFTVKGMTLQEARQMAAAISRKVREVNTEK